MTAEQAIPSGRLTEAISGHLVESGDRRIWLTEGRDVMATLSGPDGLAGPLERDEATPVSMAPGDLDGDGVADLVCGYSIPGGNGLESPFLAGATVLGVPYQPDFIGTGDFDADGHQDVVIGTLGLDKLVFLRGIGGGRFEPPDEVGLPGSLTAMTVGDLNRRDGLPDIAAGVAGRNGFQLLVFEGPGGAMRATGE